MMRSLLKLLIAVVSAVFAVGVLLIFSFSTGYEGLGEVNSLMCNDSDVISSSLHRKLLHREAEVKPNRAWGLKGCTPNSIVINQGPTAPLPSGVPTYLVEISNACPTGCDISGIHISCGWFSSVRLINPTLFKRVKYDDCLVKDGKTLAAGEMISFAYANSFSYRMSVSSIVCQ